MPASRKSPGVSVLERWPPPPLGKAASMGDLLAVDRMTDAQLWTCCIYELIHLVASRPGELSWAERRGMARRALECITELRTRGQQLSLGLSADTR